MAQPNLTGAKRHQGSREKASAAAKAGSGHAAGGHDSMKADKEKKLAKKPDKKKNDEALDEALEESFPASDPPSVSQPSGRGPAGDPATKP